MRARVKRSARRGFMRVSQWGSLAVALASLVGSCVVLPGCLEGVGPREATVRSGQPSERQLGATSKIEPGWLARAQRRIAEREYEAGDNGVGLQAPNRAHNFRAYFEPTGVRLHDRTAAGSPSLADIALVGVGRGDALDPIEPGAVMHDGARVEIHRPGLVEWYENSPRGLEQGFNVSSRPSGEGTLVLEISIAEGTARHRGGLVVLETGARRLSYGDLAALDASGTPLATRFEVPSPHRVRILVDDAAAAYPITVDPLLTAIPDARIDSDQAQTDLGTSVAGAGDVNGDGYADGILGAPLYDAGQVDEGAAFIFLGSQVGFASEDSSGADARLESDQAGAELGWSVAGAGDVNGDGFDDVIVGAPFYTFEQGLGPEGAALVFVG